MIVLVLFVQYDTVKYPNAYNRLEAHLAAFSEIRWVIFRIDNARPFRNLEYTGVDCYSMGGDNADWEFSGWRLGLEQASRIVPEYNGVLFINDSFEVSGPSLLESINILYIKIFIIMNIPLGNVDYLINKETIYNIKIKKWIRTNCFILSKKIIERLGNIVFINDMILDDFVDRNHTGKYFNDNAPISPGLQQRVVTWLSNEWHSSFIIENNWNLFRNKTKAMLNEWLLGSKLSEVSPLIIDIRLLSGKGILRFFLCEIKNCLVKTLNFFKTKYRDNI